MDFDFAYGIVEVEWNYSLTKHRCDYSIKMMEQVKGCGFLVLSTYDVPLLRVGRRVYYMDDGLIVWIYSLIYIYI